MDEGRTFNDGYRPLVGTAWTVIFQREVFVRTGILMDRSW